MDELTMIDLHAIPLLVILPVCFAGGLVLGFAYFSILRRTVDLLVTGDQPILGLALTLGRFVLLAAGLYIAVLAGAFALLAALAGVLCAKRIMLRRTRGDQV
ncbi:ATP synthase subunit I [Thalassovita sp.]|uniref:N-ATPase subunit AtpR n=1 Tax=Thalassovita sp. TaxID=1979401 RepID=UPI002B27C05D|nr:ATP synthase subunit I [Thalassovita sp.]